MRILIIEDEVKTAEYLKKGLVENGFIVDIAHEGETGLYQAVNYVYDLIILDIMLPKMDGFSLLVKLRKTHHDVKVLMLTARDSVDDKVKGLEYGADDYLVKPFSFSELLARVRTLLRRGIANKQEIVCVADLKLDVVKHKALRGDVVLDLTPKEFSLLYYLVQRRGEVVSRTIIAENVWDMNFCSDTNVVDVAVRRLRKKMDDPFPNKLIHTIRGMGYKLEERT